MKALTSASAGAVRTGLAGRPETRQFAALLLALLGACASPGGARTLRDVRTWAIQLQGIEHPGTVERLRVSNFDLLVLDPPSSVRGLEAFDSAGMVAELRPRHLCLAYLNVGQAEEYRTYWQRDWKAPKRDEPGDPAFLLTVDPEGWVGDYPVAYWESSWKSIVLARVGRIARLGFDGVYCDWVLGFENPAVIAAARRAGLDPEAEMAALLKAVKIAGKSVNPGFLVVMQNGGRILESAPELPAWVDGYVQECVSFRGEAGARWDDPAAADIPLPAEGDWSTTAMLAKLQNLHRRGLPVFSLDYAARPENIELARRRARRVGAVPFVTRTPLDRLP